MMPCPTCGNDREFIISSRQVQEDLCEVCASCKCGFSTPHGYRFESIMGGLGDDNTANALACWNDAMLKQKPEAIQ